MTSLPFRCTACGEERLVDERERGRTAYCHACGGAIEVPESLAFPEPAQIRAVKKFGLRLDTVLLLSLYTGLLPVSAACWWFAGRAIGRAEEAGLPVERQLRFTWMMSIVVTVGHALIWTVVLAAVWR